MNKKVERRLSFSTQLENTIVVSFLVLIAYEVLIDCVTGRVGKTKGLPMAFKKL